MCIRDRPYLDIRPLATATQVLLGLCVLTSVLGALAALYELYLLDRMAAGQVLTRAQEVSGEGATLLVAVGQALLYLPTRIVYLIWLHRASGNQRPLGARSVSLSPGWAVGSWFIPFVNLVMPYLAVREIWIHSARAARGEIRLRAPRTPTGSWLVGLWWALWIFNMFAAVAISMTWILDSGPGGESLDDFARTEAEASAAINGLSIPLGVLAYLVVRRISLWQHHAVEHPGEAEIFD